VKPKYKIHAFDTVYEKGSTAANTNKFYDSMGEAIEMAKNCLRRPNNTADSIVIMKSVAIVELESPPFRVSEIED
jgi:hypothetical protein